MNQSSVYKRDFRDPRHSENLWNFIFNRKCCNIEAHGNDDSQEISIRQQLKNANDSDLIETKCRENGEIADYVKSTTVITTRCQDNKNLCRTKSMTCEKFDRHKKYTAFGPNNQNDDCYKYRISDFPTVIDRFVPREQIPKNGRLTTEYRENINRIGKIIIKYKIHDHKKCGKDGSHCEHPLMVLARPKKIY